MCSSEDAVLIAKAVAEKSAELLGADFKCAILYGSYARGDFDSDSDIDIMVLADIPADSCTAFRRSLTELTSSLGLEYDVLVSVTVRDVVTFEKWLDVLPFYQNINREGVKFVA